MPSVLSSPTAPAFSPQTLREISTRRYLNGRNTILIHGSSFSGQFGRTMNVFHQQNLVRATSIRRFGNFNGVQATDLEDDKPGLRKTELEVFEFTVNRMSKWLLAVIFSLIILWKHDAEVMWAAMGSILNSWFSVLLKNILHQERPSALRSDPGMPSSHAQSLFFAIAFALLSLIDWMKINGLTISIGTFTLICGSYLSWLRVSQQLHTISQVLVGAVIGSICGLTWFWMWHELVLETFISTLWVQNFVVFSAAGLCVTYFLLNIQNWLRGE